MQRFANELLEETPTGVPSATAQRLVSSVASVASVSLGLGVSGLGIIGLLITPGCGLPT
jgi:hypothetical protein